MYDDPPRTRYWVTGLHSPLLSLQKYSIGLLGYFRRKVICHYLKKSNSYFFYGYFRFLPACKTDLSYYPLLDSNHRIINHSSPQSTNFGKPNLRTKTWFKDSSEGHLLKQKGAVKKGEETKIVIRTRVILVNFQNVIRLLSELLANQSSQIITKLL